MAKFKTLDGKEWLVEVNYLTVKRVRDLCGVNVLDICNLDKETLSGWVSDDIKVLEVICAVVRPQLATLDMADDEFFAACDGGVLKEAVERLVDQVSDFFQEPRKGLVKKVIQKLRETERKMETAAATAIDKALASCEFEQALEFHPPGARLACRWPAARKLDAHGDADEPLGSDPPQRRERRAGPDHVPLPSVLSRREAQAARGHARPAYGIRLSASKAGGARWRLVRVQFVPARPTWKSSPATGSFSRA
jgi:hypothetical protein